MSKMITMASNATQGPMVPSGYALVNFQMNTVDRMNMDTASFAVTGTGYSQTFNGDAGGRAQALIPIPSSGNLNVHLNHNGQYYNDDDQVLVVESGGIYWVYFDLFDYPQVSTVIEITTTFNGSGVQGVSVQATDGSTTMSAITQSNGMATLHGLTAGEWTIKVPSYNIEETITVEQLLQTYSFELPGIHATVTGYNPQTVTVTLSGASSGTYHSDNNGDLWIGPLTPGQYTLSTNYESKAVTITNSVQTVSIKGTANVYGVKVTKSVSDPEDRVTYYMSAAGVTPASGHNLNGWAGNELLGQIAPVRISNGVKAYLNKRNLSQLTSGSSSSISTLGNDAFTEFKQIYFRVYSDGEADYFEFSLEQVSSDFNLNAWMQNGVAQSAFYIGCFAGIVSSSKLYSQSGSSPTVSTSITNFIAYAKARGAGYDIIRWYQMMFIQALFILLYKSTDCQTALGQGYVGGSAKQSQNVTTFDNDYGMAGSTSTTEQMAFLWITNLWGNVYQFVGGAKTGSDCSLKTILGDYSSVTDSDFTDRDTEPKSSRSGYVKDICGGEHGGFFPKSSGGSSTTFWCDDSVVSASRFPYFGGRWSYGSNAGFYWYFYGSATSTNTGIGSRLSYNLGIA